MVIQPGLMENTFVSSLALNIAICGEIPWHQKHSQLFLDRWDKWPDIKFLIGYRPKRVQEVQNFPPHLICDQMLKDVKAGHWLLNEESFFLNLIIYKALNFRWQHHHVTPKIPSLENENIKYSNISNHRAANHNIKKIQHFLHSLKSWQIRPRDF